MGLIVTEAVVWNDHLDLVSHDRGIAVLAAEVSGDPDIEPGEPVELTTDFSTRQYVGRKQIILPDGSSPVTPTPGPPRRRHRQSPRVDGGDRVREVSDFDPPRPGGRSG